MSHALGAALERDMERKKEDPESPPGRVLATHRPRSTRSGGMPRGRGLFRTGLGRHHWGDRAAWDFRRRDWSERCGGSKHSNVLRYGQGESHKIDGR